MLELVEVTKKYSVVPAVNRVRFLARPSEVVGYLGPNGAGKIKRQSEWITWTSSPG
jgi:ABC-2 type transport system ATP-binding protein